MLASPPEIARDATLMVLAKGFRISQDSEEFQLVSPPNLRALTHDLESRLARNEAWPRVLGELYSVSREQMLTLPCVLLAPSAALALSVAPARDRYGRPTVVAVSATSSIDWSSSAVEEIVAHTAALARFAAADLSRRFEGSPREVVTNLRKERVDLALDAFAGATDDGIEFWRAIIRCAREWKGILGLAAAPLAHLGGNVVIGTEYEAVRLAGSSSASVDGFYDAAQQRIVRISQNLTLWPQVWLPEEHVEPAPVGSIKSDEPQLIEQLSLPQEQTPPESEPGFESIAGSLKGIEKSLSSMVDLTSAIFESFREFLGGNGRRKK